MLSSDLRAALAQLRELLFSEDGTEIEQKDATSESDKKQLSAKVGVGGAGATIGAGGEVSVSNQTSQEQTSRFIQDKLKHLHRHIIDYQALFRRMAALSGGDAYLILDELYHIPRRNQAQVLDYFHRIGKGNNLWLKVGTIRHRTQWYVHGDPPIGVKIGDDIADIDLDQTLEKYRATSDFLEKILGNFLTESSVVRNDFIVRGAIDRLVLASGGVARDFLGLLRRSILIARDRGDTARGEKVGVEDVNGAAGEYDSSKREELTRDTIDERQNLESEFADIARFVNQVSKANVFLMDKGLPDEELQPIEELVDLRLVHRVRARVSVADRPGKTFEAFMLDVSQYTAARKKREVEIIEFWRPDAVDAIRRAGYIYKEWDGKNVIKKTG